VGTIADLIGGFLKTFDGFWVTHGWLAPKTRFLSRGNLHA